MCEECDGIDAPCDHHKQQLKAIKRDIRRRIRALYDARAECEACQEYAEKFGSKLVEYLWRRQTKKEGRNSFMELIGAIKAFYET